MVWLRREDLSPFDCSEGEIGEVGQVRSDRIMLHYSDHPVADVLPLMDSVERQDLQEEVSFFDGVHLWRWFYVVAPREG